MMRRRLCALALLAIPLAGLALSLVVGHVLTKPVPAYLGPPPAELHAQALSFPSDSGVTLRGWYAPGETHRGAVVLLHGVRSNRQSMVGRAMFLHRAGYGVLLVDFQAHGESAGDRITFGYRESADARAAIRQVRAMAVGEKVGALGVSLGAASLVFANAQPRLSAVVLEALYPTIEEAIQNRLRLYLGPLGPLLAPALLWQLKPRLGASAEALRPIDRVGAMHVPTLLLHGDADRHTTLQEADRVFAALAEPKERYVFPGAAHVDLHRFAATTYEGHVLDFFSRYVRDADAPQ